MQRKSAASTRTSSRVVKHERGQHCRIFRRERAVQRARALRARALQNAKAVQFVRMPHIWTCTSNMNADKDLLFVCGNQTFKLIRTPEKLSMIKISENGYDDSTEYMTVAVKTTSWSTADQYCLGLKGWKVPPAMSSSSVDTNTSTLWSERYKPFLAPLDSTNIMILSSAYSSSTYSRSDHDDSESFGNGLTDNVIPSECTDCEPDFNNSDCELVV